MESRIGWIDLSSNDLNKVRSLMDGITGGVIDELGIGTIRDKYSNQLFTGISTLFTRAKYYFITPYILLEKEHKQNNGETGLQYFQRSEIELNKIINKYYTEHNTNNESYFGKDTKSGELKRQPSDVYWNGIVHLGLIQDATSLNELLRRKKSSVEELLSKTSDDELTREQGVTRRQDNINVGYSKDWLNDIKQNGLQLTRTEAETLCSRIKQKNPHSLITELLKDKSLWEDYNDSIVKNKVIEDHKIFALTNPFVQFVEKSILVISDNELKNNLIESHDLAIFLHGLHIAYNIALWETVGCDSEFITNLRECGNKWRNQLNNKLLCRSLLNKEFDISTCIDSSKAMNYTKDFLQDAQRLILENETWGELEDELKHICKNQELINKKIKSRFYKIEHKQTIPDMDRVKWIGLSLISYRYYSARSIISDIYAGIDNVKK